MNMKAQNHILRLAVCGVACLPVGVLAQQQEQEGQQVSFGGALLVEGRYVQNANRAGDEDQQVDEFQSRYGANVFGEIDREILTLSADYDLYQNDYAKDTQEDRFTRTGRSELVFGTQNTFYQIEAAHSTQRFLFNPEGPAVLENTDQRDIFSVAPLLRLRPGRADSISVVGTYQDVRYKLTDINDSERIGAGIGYSRQLSPVYLLAIRALQNEVDYKTSDEGDYTYRRAGVMFESDLRLLNYSIEVGMNEARLDQADDQGPVDELYYDLSLSYGEHRNGWEMTAQRLITDTSLGNANDPFFSEGYTSDVSNRVQDRLERTGYGATIRTSAVCRLCDLSLGVGYEEEDYFTITSENQEEMFARLMLRYHLRASVSLDFGLDHRLRTFADGDTEVDDEGPVDFPADGEPPFDRIGTGNGEYSDSSALVAVSFTPLIGSLEARLWAEHQNRNPDQGQGYSTNSIGLTLGYLF